jgi:hypothetical protein
MAVAVEWRQRAYADGVQVQVDATILEQYLQPDHIGFVGKVMEGVAEDAFGDGYLFKSV